MRIVTLALKDLQQVFRDKMAFLMLVLMPIVFTIFMGFALGGTKSSADARLPLGWNNQDGSSLLSTQLEAQLHASGAVHLIKIDASQANDQVSSGKLAAALVAPAGFSDQTLAGKTLPLTLIVDSSSQAGQTAQQVVQAALGRTLSMAQTALLDADALHSARPDLDAAALLAEEQSAVQQAAAAWNQPALTVQVEKAQAQVQPTSWLEANPYQQSSPGIMVMFVLFGLITSASALVVERQTGSLRRLLTTSMGRAEIIAGHLLAMFTITFLQEVLLVTFGQLVYGVNYLRQPLAALLVMVGLGLWVTCLGLLIAVLVKNQDQVVLFSLIPMFLFSALGGCWFPLEVAGPAFVRIGYLTPGAWAMKGFQDIILRGQGLSEALQPSGIMLAYAAGFFIIAVWLFQRRLAAS